MPLAAQSAGPGDTVHSVGNSGVLAGKLWRYTAGKVRSVYQAEILTGAGRLIARVIETQSPINGGDSGGPLVNDRGELVGVVNSRQKEASLVSFSIDVSEVRAFLAEVRGPTKPDFMAGHQPRAKLPWGPDWPLAIFLIGAIGVLLFLGKKAHRQIHPGNSTAPRTREEDASQSHHHGEQQTGV
jgi:hypothetical protein